MEHDIALEVSCPECGAKMRKDGIIRRVIRATNTIKESQRYGCPKCGRTTIAPAKPQ